MKKLIAVGAAGVTIAVFAGFGAPVPADDRPLLLDGPSSATAAVTPSDASPSLADLRLPTYLQDPCPDSCVLCPETTEEHACWEDAGMGGDLCLHDESCTRQGDCEDHSCDPEEEEEDFDRLLVEVNAAMELIPAASSAEIRHFVSANADAVAFNRARQAIQFFRCEGGSKILAQVPLPAVVARDLARALDSDR